MSKTPSFLEEHHSTYQEDPRQATLEWFKGARFGLFMHYGLYSLLGRGEWVMFEEKIPVSEYEELKDEFTAESFDAGSIADLALDSGMSYVNITTRHHDGFCLFETDETDFNSVQAPCGTDLIRELSRACEERGLGLFLYYSYALDWRHPYYMSRESGPEVARPDYPDPEPHYKYSKEEDFQCYLDFVHAQLRELLTGYGPLAGIWFDPILPYYIRADMFPIEETYSLIHSLQPQALICFKQGATGNEDFASCEREAGSLAHRLSDEKAPLADSAWSKNRSKHNEICDTLQPSAWGHSKEHQGKHKGPDQVWDMLGQSLVRDHNLLLNTGPHGDGSIDEQDRSTLREVGKRLERQGFPC